MHTLIPGEWYLLYLCRNCKVNQILFPDLSRGTSMISADYGVTCRECGDRATYDGEEIIRYQHPVDGDGKLL